VSAFIPLTRDNYGIANLTAQKVPGNKNHAPSASKPNCRQARRPPPPCEKTPLFVEHSFPYMFVPSLSWKNGRVFEYKTVPQNKSLRFK
jgi:hypothetical protein